MKERPPLIPRQLPSNAYNKREANLEVHVGAMFVEAAGREDARQQDKGILRTNFSCQIWTSKLFRMRIGASIARNP